MDENRKKITRTGSTGEGEKNQLTIVILIIALIFALINWLKNYITSASVIYFMKKNSIHPTDEEMNECVKFVVNKMFRRG